MNQADFAIREALEKTRIEHELAMSIGVALDLRGVLEPFLHTARRLFELNGIHFYRDLQDSQFATDDESTPSIISTPDTPRPQACEELVHALLEQGGDTLQRQHEDVHYLVIRLPDIGALVLASNTPHVTQPLTLPDLEPVLARLTLACATCIEHQRALQDSRNTVAPQATNTGEASHDALTELPNRKTLQLRLRQALAAAIRHEHFGAVFFIDVDRFKTVNDSLGHAAGDAVLLALSQRLQAAARDEDTLARVGGDEFILVASNLGSDAKQAAHAAQALAARLATDCRRPVDVRGASVHISTSMGICIYPNPKGHSESSSGNGSGSSSPDRSQSSPQSSPQSNPRGDSASHTTIENDSLDAYCENIIRFADTAMYRTKHHGRDGFEFFAPQMQAAADRRLTLEQQLRLALQRDELTVHFQPLVTSFGAVIGAEALLRWHHSDLGDVEPEEFIPVAEESGLILEIGAWVIQQVCELVRDISASERYRQFAYISVNVSPRQIKQADFVDKIRACIDAAGTPPSGLRLEITEHAAIDNIEDTISKMKELNKLGIMMSLDDFGTGYSSLSYLHRLPICSLKLDRTFVTSIANHEENQAIVDATIAMAGHLGIECIPEGIELEGDVEYFRSRPVHTMQGFYFSAALPLDQFLNVLENGSLGPIADLIHQLPISWPRDDPDEKA